MLDLAQKVKENRTRRRLERRGFLLTKTRARPNAPSRFWVQNARTGAFFANLTVGRTPDASDPSYSLDEIICWLDETDAAPIPTRAA